MVANQSSYGRAVDHAMKTFVTKEQELSNMDIRDQKDPKPKVFLENPNSFVLLFQNHYKFDQRNPRAGELSRYISGKLVVFSRASNSGKRSRGKKEKF